MSIPRYAELHAHSCYAFQKGVNTPQVMIETAQKLNLSGISLLDYNGFYGLIEAQSTAQNLGFPLICGAELTMIDGTHLPILTRGLEGYQKLSQAISDLHLKQGRKQNDLFTWDFLSNYANSNWFILTGNRNGPLARTLKQADKSAALHLLSQLKEIFGAENIGVESCLSGISGESGIAILFKELSQASKLPLIATTGACCATPASRPLADVMRAIKLRKTLDECYRSGDLPPRAEMLLTPQEVLQIHQLYPEAVDNAADLAQDYAYRLKLREPQMPTARVPAGHTEASWLAHLTWQGAALRYGNPLPKLARLQLDKELEIITKMQFCGYFLIVKEIVDFCASENIFVQGRGSAANSAVCYCLGITAVDAVRHQMIFDRFLTTERKELPDIDLDIESRRREEVFAHIYQKYGRKYSAQVANIISYKPRSAIRDAARAFGYAPNTFTPWLKLANSSKDLLTQPVIPKKVAAIAQQLVGLPRHMGIHCGGIVLTSHPLAQVVPVDWGGQDRRTVVQWDKQDCATAGLVKIDLLALGMMGALHTAFEMLAAQNIKHPDGTDFTLYNLPAEDPAVYELLYQADTVGVFQVESRAQMNTLPRLHPTCFYDLVVEVALIRPGPIQGQSVHPYLRRRQGKEPVTYLHPLLEPILKKTLGVALFQEQLIQIAKIAAGFDAAQADQLRSAMSAKRSTGNMAALKTAFYQGLANNQIRGETADAIWEQMKGFALFGFPESHAFSFAYLVYASAWLKAYYPAVFYAAILANQPMGFYSPQSLLNDASRHQIEILGPCINQSTKHAQGILNAGKFGTIRLGLSQINELPSTLISAILSNRETGGKFLGPTDLARRVNLSQLQWQRLITAGALDCFGFSRTELLWKLPQLLELSQAPEQLTLPTLEHFGRAPKLPAPSIWEKLQQDFASTSTTLGVHPLKLLRPRLDASEVYRITDITPEHTENIVEIAGMVTHRQRPPTAGGTVFLSLEDETGLMNVVCSSGLWNKYRHLATLAGALLVQGKVRSERGSISIQAHRLSPLNTAITVKSRDFR